MTADAGKSAASFMEFNQVRYFLTLAGTLNFTRAAEACNVTQPALTRAIQKLEEELGGLLFHRERNLTQLTELGQLMLPLLEQASAAAQSAREQAQAFKRRDAAPLRLGLDPSIAADMLIPVIAELEARIKGFELSLREGSSSEIARLLLEGTLDAGLVVGREPINERLNRWTLYDEGLVVLCAPTHRFSALADVSLALLGEEPILRREGPDCALAADLDRLCAEAGVALQRRHSGASDDHLHAMAKASLGIMVAGEYQKVPAGLVAKTLVPEFRGRAITLVAIAGRGHGLGVTNFLNLMRARDWNAPDGKPAGDSAKHGFDNQNRLAGQGRPGVK